MKKIAKVLIVTDLSLFPAHEGNRRRVVDILSLYRGIEAEVSLLYVNYGSRQSAESMRSRLGLPAFVYTASLYERLKKRFYRARAVAGWVARIAAWRNYPLDAWYPEGLTRFAREQAGLDRYDVVQVEYVYLSRLLESTPRQTTRVIDAHDVLSDRWSLFRRSGLLTTWYSITRRDERVGMQRSTHLFAISQGDAEHFREIDGPQTLTVDILNPYAGGWCGIDGHALFVGSNNRMNRDGLKAFIATALPRILEQEPGFVLDVVGSVAEGIEPGPGLRLIGRVDDLDAALRSAALMVNPVRVGTGLAIKSVEALRLGLPVVSTPTGARGLEGFAGKGIVVCDALEGMADALIDLMRHRPRLAVLSGEIAREYEQARLKCLAEVKGCVKSPS